MNWQITDKIRSLARQYHQDIINVGIRNTPNRSGYTHPDNFYRGYVGELLCKNCFEFFGLKHVYVPHPDGKPDRTGDMTIFWGGTWKTVDIKTNWHTSSIKTKMVFPKYQLNIKAYDIYLAVQILTDNKGQISGYTFPHELVPMVGAIGSDGKPKVSVPQVGRYYEDMYPVENLIGKTKEPPLKELFPEKIKLQGELF